MDIYHRFQQYSWTTGQPLLVTGIPKGNRAVIFTGGGGGCTVDLYTYTASGATEANRVCVATTEIFPLTVWGISGASYGTTPMSVLIAY